MKKLFLFLFLTLEIFAQDTLNNKGGKYKLMFLADKNAKSVYKKDLERVVCLVEGSDFYGCDNLWRKKNIVDYLRSKKNLYDTADLYKTVLEKKNEGKTFKIVESDFFIEDTGGNLFVVVFY